MLKNTIDIVGSSCTACSACVYSCPKGAIKIETSGFKKAARIDESLCVGCGACTAVCHKCAPMTKSESLVVYAAWANERVDEAASGGIATEIYKSFLSEGGVCFGAAWREGAFAKICMADSTEQVEAFAGSKYVESDLSYAFSDIREAIKAGKKIIFVGLPCQVAAVKKLFNSELLYTADLVCHGTPMAEHFDEYIKSIGVDIGSARFRGKEDFVLRLFNKNDECIYREGQHFDPYFKAFLEGLTYKECCYSCPYACTSRVGDVTLGDFWGIDRGSLENPPSSNISLLLVNTQKGVQIVEMLLDRCTLVERTIEEAVRENKQLTAPSEIHSERKSIAKNLVKYGFVKALNKTKIAKNIKNRNSFFSKAKRKIKLILGR